MISRYPTVMTNAAYIARTGPMFTTGDVVDERRTWVHFLEGWFRRIGATSFQLQVNGQSRDTDVVLQSLQVCSVGLEICTVFWCQLLTPTLSLINNFLLWHTHTHAVGRRYQIYWCLNLLRALVSLTATNVLVRWTIRLWCRSWCVFQN